MIEATHPARTADPIDRQAPTCRPAGPVVMRHRWAHLLFLHWAVPPEAIRPLIPQGLDLDTFEGEAYVGLVPFTMEGVRPRWAPAWRPLTDFHEVNVRTYVHRAGRDPGVWFFSLDAANPAAVVAARTLWHLPYHYARIGLDRRGDSIAYRSERRWPGPRPATCAIEYEPVGTPARAEPGTREHFLAERYILYARRRGRLVLGRIHHSPYPLQPAVVHAWREDLIAAAGIARPAVPPLAHYAAEVRTEIFPLEPVAP